MTVEPVAPAIGVAVVEHETGAMVGVVEVEFLLIHPPCGHQQCHQLIALLTATVRISESCGVRRQVAVPMQFPEMKE